MLKSNPEFDNEKAGPWELVKGRRELQFSEETTSIVKSLKADLS
jgi:hypothetical protein